MNPLLESLLTLSVEEKLQLAQDLWDSIEQDSIPVMTDKTYAELQRRTAWAEANPESAVSLDELAESLGARLLPRQEKMSPESKMPGFNLRGEPC